MMPTLAAAVHTHFVMLDWIVLLGYLALTTLVGHLMSGKQSTIRDFFLGGRSLPWPAVCGSIIATEISGVTFIGVPGTIFALHGDFTYMLWGIGSILGRIVVALYFVPAFYQGEIYSPYDFMGRRLGRPAKTLATCLFTLGSILAQSVRVLVAAIPLQVVTDFPIQWCIIIIGLVAIGWTLMGGMQTVIWTDVMQFGLFVFGGVLALVWLISGLAGGWGEFWTTASQFDRLNMWDARLQANLEFTFWVAILAVPFQNLAAFGVDQLNAQRMFCCRDQKAAAKALIWSSTGQLLTLLMLMGGAALFVHYQENPFTPAEAQIVFPAETAAESVALAESAPRIENAATGAQAAIGVPGEPDFVFPMWITTMLPAGVTGLILAGVFAAAISSLDSILAALSQTTLSLFYHPEDKTDEELEKLNLVTKSRLLVIMWGVILTGCTFLLYIARDGIPILPLAFGMTSYTVGPLLAMFLCALWNRGTWRGLVVGTVISLTLVLFMRMDVWVLVAKAGANIDWLLALPTYARNAAGGVSPTVFTAWAWPLTTIVTLLCGLLLPRPRPEIPTL